MLRNFLHLWPAIRTVILSSNTKAFKKNRNVLLLSDADIVFLTKCLRILEVFIKATTKLQADKYPTIYYLLPEVYNIYNELKIIKGDLNQVSKLVYKYKCILIG
jgi:hypothetical protein